MNKSVIIILGITWLICATYLGLATAYHWPNAAYARLGTWTSSLLLLVCIIIFVKKHRDNKRTGK